MKLSLVFTVLATTLLATVVTGRGGPEMSLKFSGIGGSTGTKVEWTTKLGKYKNGAQAGDTPTFEIKHCSIKFVKSFRVKDSGSKWRSYPVGLGECEDAVDALNASLKGKVFSPWSGNGNTDGFTKLLNTNTACAHLDQKLSAGVADAVAACEAESIAKGWSTGGEICKPMDGILLRGQCNYRSFPDGNFGPHLKIRPIAKLDL